MEERQAIVELDKELQRRIRAWGKMTRNRMLLTLANMGVHDQVRNFSKLRTLELKSGTRLVQEKALRESLFVYLKKFRGEVDSISISFERHGIFLQHGVGKGRPVRSPEAKRAAKPWLTVALNETTINQLADIMEEVYGDAAVKSLSIMIPGVLNFSTDGS